jgi:rhodanese-related sulfurtransferase
MAAPDKITSAQLSRLIGTPDAPIIVDVREDAERAKDRRFIPASLMRDHSSMSSWDVSVFTGKSVVAVCQCGNSMSQGVAAWLRHAGVGAETLDGGFDAWVQAKGMLVNPAQVPDRDTSGRTVWVTRARPKIDRIACPWLIRRFIDPSAVFLFVASTEVRSVAECFGATPFDIEDIFWSHRGPACTFDAMLEEFGLASEALGRLATIVRAADTAQLDLAPEAAGLLAASLGLSRMYRDDLIQLDAGIALYDAFYRWARDAAGETHNWPNVSGGRS